MLTKKMKKNTTFLNVFKKYYSSKKVFSLRFFSFHFFVENYNVNLFLVIFKKKSSFFIILKILFLFIIFQFIPNVHAMVTNHAQGCPCAELYFESVRIYSMIEKKTSSSMDLVQIHKSNDHFFINQLYTLFPFLIY